MIELSNRFNSWHRLLPEVFKNSIPDPRVLEAMGKKVSDKDLEETFVISTSSEEHIKNRRSIQG